MTAVAIDHAVDGGRYDPGYQCSQEEFTVGNKRVFERKQPAPFEDIAAEEACIYDASSDQRGVAVECEVRMRMVTRKDAVRIEKFGGSTSGIDARVEDEHPLDGSQGAGCIHVIGV